MSFSAHFFRLVHTYPLYQNIYVMYKIAHVSKFNDIILVYYNIPMKMVVFVYKKKSFARNHSLPGHARTISGGILGRM